MATKVKLGTDAQWGVKENGVLGFNDENGVFKAIELASSRASSATYVAESGLIADAESGVPRIDYTNGVGELLLEPQSTNEITYSEDFTDSSWVKSNVNLTSNTILSPDGSVNASLIKSDGVGNFPRLETSVSASGDCTYSVFVKKELSDEITLYVVGTGLGGGADTTSVYRYVFDTDSFIKRSGADADTITSVDYGNGWIKLSMSVASTTITQVRLYTDWSNASTDGVYVWGAQLEELSYPTSYIRTSGSSVTRIADAVTGNSSLGQVINSSEGVLYAEMSAFIVDSNLKDIVLRLDSSNRIILRFDSGVDAIESVLVTGGTTSCLLSGGSGILSGVKCALKWKENDFALWVNGVEVATDPSGSTYSSNTLTTIDFGQADSNPFYGRVKEVKVYDTALTDAELTTLTTL